MIAGRLCGRARLAALWLPVVLAWAGGPAAGNDEPKTNDPPKTDDGAGGHEKTPYRYPTPIPLDALDRMPDDATAYCGDGSWSSAADRKEACTDHKGVKVWFGPAPKGATGRCRDGTWNLARAGTPGACSGHGGVRSGPAKPARS